MATTKEYIEWVCEQIRDEREVQYKKMFGEYMVYIHGKPLLLVCDNTVYVKMLEELRPLLGEAPRGFPYDGAKEHYILDVENAPLRRAVIDTIEQITPLPKPHSRRKTS